MADYKNILVTGSAGFLGHGITTVLDEAGYALRLCDVAGQRHERHECVAGDVTDFAVCRELAAGMDAVVIAHMLGRTGDEHAYDNPEAPFDVNVKGTANLFAAAVHAGIKRVVLISSANAVDGHLVKGRKPASLRARPGTIDLYALTKGCQELIAEHYQARYGLEVAVLRVGWIIDAATHSSKYGPLPKAYSPTMIDRYDIGRAVAGALGAEGLEYEAFWVMGGEGAEERFSMAETYGRLGWKPERVIRKPRTKQEESEPVVR